MSPVIDVVRTGHLAQVQPSPPTSPGRLHSPAEGSDVSLAGGLAPSAETWRPPVEGSHGHVLVVDDEPDIRKVLRALLEEEGYLVAEAVDGAAGIALLQASLHPLVVLVDYKMPRMNGAEMLEAVMADPQLAERHAFIFVTANLPVFSPQLRQLLTAA